MNIDLPLETWAQLLGFLPRPYLGGIVLRIGNRQLAAIVHFFLHKYGQVKLGILEIERDEHGGAVVRKGWNRHWGVAGPAEPIDLNFGILKNIKDFNALYLSHFDNTVVLPWLQKFADHHLFTNAHLDLRRYNLSGLLYTLPMLLPMLDSVGSVRVQDQLALAMVCSRDEKQKEGNSLAKSWLARVRILQI